jgi:hypothetical protein
MAAGESSSLRTWSLDDITASEILTWVRETEAARMASVQNYLIVERVNIAPMPTVVYRERETVNGQSGYRQVPLPELAQMEAKATAASATTPDEKAAADLMADPTAFLGALAAGLDALTGNQSGTGTGGLGAVADGLRKVQTDVAEQAKQDRQEAHEDLVNSFLIAVNERTAGEALKMFGFYYPDREPASRRFDIRPRAIFLRTDRSSGFIAVGEPGPDKNVIDGEVWTPLPPDALLCFVIVLDGPFDVDVNGRVHTVEEVEQWVAIDPYFEMNVAKPGTDLGVEVFTKIVAFETTQSGFGPRFVLEKESDEFRQVGPMLVPHRNRERMSADGQQAPEGVKTTHKVSVNEGPPTQEQIAALVNEVIGGAVEAAGW